jgi:hypothetical protein
MKKHPTDKDPAASSKKPASTNLPPSDTDDSAHETLDPSVPAPEERSTDAGRDTAGVPLFYPTTIAMSVSGGTAKARCPSCFDTHFVELYVPYTCEFCGATFKAMLQ